MPVEIANVELMLHEGPAVLSMVRDLSESRASENQALQAERLATLGNETRLAQVVTNLMVNAAHAIPEGKLSAHQITVRLKQSGQGEAVLEVSDTGHGMSAETKARLFEPFFTTKPAGIGTGLGLSICKRIVSSLRGTIEVESEVGRGTTFRIRLPAAPEPAAAT